MKIKIKKKKHQILRYDYYEVIENGALVDCLSTAQRAFDFCASQYPGIEVEVDIK